MITTSEAWKEYSEEHDIYHIKATLYDGNFYRHLQLTDEDFMIGSVSFTDAVSSSDSFDLGSVIINTFECTLNNTSGKFDGFDFGGGRIIVWFGIKYEDETEEWIKRGIYVVDRPYSMGYTIKITAYDFMDFLNRTYVGKDANYDDIVFPLSSHDLVDIASEVCEFEDYFEWNVPNDLIIDEFEYNESTTWREVLGYICQINGAYARANADGNIEINWYDGGVLVPGDSFNGGTMSPWSSVATADGGTMQPWTVGYVLNGDHYEPNINITQVSSYNMYSGDIHITGVRVYVPNTVNEFDFVTQGTQGYILAVEDNPLVTTENKGNICYALYQRLRGMTFRPFTASVYGDPSLEAGDYIKLYDYQGNPTYSYITNLTYHLNGITEISCGAETPTDLSNDYASTTTSTIAGAVIASYDYIQAKKISADYISAGVIEADVEARNFTMKGGSIDIETDDDTTDHIILNYRANDERVISEVSTKRISFTWDGQGSKTEAELSYDGLSLYQDNIPSAFVSFNGIYTSGDVNSDGSMYAQAFVNTSRLDLKRDVAKADSVLDKIKSADILTFNFRDEKENAKAHVGLAIGGGYNVPDDVIVSDDDGVEQGVDLYSMVSMAWKAIQEQQEIIENLQSRIEALEKKQITKPIKDIMGEIENGNTD